MHDDQDQASTEKVDNPLDKARHALGEVLRSGDTPEEIDGYVLLERLGEGGMGEVWLAEQREPIRRQVALKLIKLGMDTKQVITRFEAERQALALMDHPAVAKVFDAGAAPDGRPYFVMEYVRGVPITEHCDRHRLNTRQRLELFRRVCDGVQHAHQKAIIHRDLKPSNVLVQESEGSRAPKIIDFGVAKATSQKLTERTLFTEQGVMIGTPEYMSPEQADLSREDVDTRTDVYSLGVMLYELLVGALPFDSRELRTAGYDEIRRRIREEEPSRPSTRLSTLGDEATDSARKRRVDLPTLQREIRGDLDWITMRALAKDRSRRYGSPQELAADVGRYLSNEPVLATPPSVQYRAGKFVKRHRLGVGVAAAALVVLVAFAGTMAVQARRIAAERDRSEEARADLESVVEFQTEMLSGLDTAAVGARLIEDLRSRVTNASHDRGSSESGTEALLHTFDDMLAGVNPTDAALRLIDVEILERALGLLDDTFAERPLLAARLQDTVGVTYQELGLFPEAEPLHAETLETRTRILGDDHPDTLRSMYRLANSYRGQGRYSEAEPLYLEALATRRRVLGGEHLDSLDSMTALASLYYNQGRYAEAEPLHAETFETGKRVLGHDHPNTLAYENNLANVYSSQRRYAEAEPLYAHALDVRRRKLGEDHPDTLLAADNVANLYFGQARYAEAEPLYAATLEARRRVHGNDHPSTLITISNLANLYAMQGHFEKAEPLRAEALKTQRRTLGDEHPHTLLSMSNLGTLLRSQRKYAEAEPFCVKALETQHRVLGESHPHTLHSRVSLAVLYQEQGRYDEAQEHYVEALETSRRARGNDHPSTLNAANGLASFLLTREPAEARDIPRALKLAEEVAEKLDYAHPAAVGTLALARFESGDVAGAVELQRKALSLLPEGPSVTREEFERALSRYEAAAAAR